ncbi:MAG: hypothetical protein ACT4QD_05895 [Acidobacteriota bacterium]
MRKVLALVAGAAFVAALASPLIAQTTVTGEVVDVACAVKKAPGGKGADHAGCAMACAKKGLPAGVMTADAIYTITGDYAANSNAKLLEFVAKRVTVTGTVTDKDGQKSIAVTSIKLAN